MAESVVAYLVSKIGTMLEGETELVKGVEDQLVFVKDELEQMRAFLRVAEAMEEGDDHQQLKVWVKQVRDVAFDMEDVLDEFQVCVQRNSAVACYNLISNLTRCIKNLHCRRQVASKIQGIKSRVSRIADARDRYKINLPEPSPRSSIREISWQERRADALLLEESDLVGTQCPKAELKRRLMPGADSAITVLSVVGMGGLGKTTLVKKVYDDMDVKKYFHARAWVDVSQSFNLEELLNKIISQVRTEGKQSTDTGMGKRDLRELKVTVKHILQATRFLLVLDDVWTTDAWDQIKHTLPRDDSGSRVIITTRNAKVASTSQMEFNCEVYPLEPLSPEDSRMLFDRKTFGKDECPSHLKDVSEQILKKCDGLPLAIVTIGGLLANKDKTVAEWGLVERSIGDELEQDNVTRILLMSYYDLPFYLKACLLYTCMFPEDYSIKPTKLIRLWISEGFLEEKQGRTLEEVGESYLNELLNRSLIQVDVWYFDGRIISYRIHDILREVLLSKARNQNFAVVCNEESRTWVDQKAARRLSVHNTSLKNAMAHNLRLRSLLYFGSDDLPEATEFIAGRLLKVLDADGVRGLGGLSKWVWKLHGLKYVSLRGADVEFLPSSIGDDLPNLETLYLKDTSVRELPKTIVKLHRLRYLILNWGAKGIEGIGGMESLQKLGWMDVSNGWMIEEIGMLKQLRKLRINSLRREDGKRFCSLISQLSHLRSLFIASTDMIDLEGFVSSSSTRSLKFLERLYLQGRVEGKVLQQWLPCLGNLTRLFLEESGLREMNNVLESIQVLPNLTLLEITDSGFLAETLKFKSDGFQRLKSLEVEITSGTLRNVELEKGAMPNLELLRIATCELLERVPLGIENLSNLQRLVVEHPHKDLVNRMYATEEGGGEDYWKIKHIPEVKCYDPDGKRICIHDPRKEGVNW